MDVLQEYLDYQVFMVRLTHAQTVDTRPFLPCREGPNGDKPKGTTKQNLELSRAHTPHARAASYLRLNDECHVTCICNS